MDWQSLLVFLEKHVPEGTITTYGKLSVLCYGHAKGAMAVASMLQAAVDNSAANAIYTNRVVGSDGSVADVNGQLAQLLKEGIPIRDRVVNMKRARVVNVSV